MMTGAGGITRGSPWGCIIGLLALLPLAAAILGFVGLFKINQLPEEEQQVDIGQMAKRAAIGGTIGFALLSWLSFRTLKRTDWSSYDAKDPRTQL